MKKKIITVVIASCCLVYGGIAQSDKENKKEESIIIKKKGDSPEKLVVEVDGDNVTINGKPVDEMQQKDIEIIKGKANKMMLRNPQGVKRIMRLREAPEAEDQLEFIMDNMTDPPNKAFLGVSSIHNEKGAKITEVTKGSAAEKAGLKEGDIITKIDDAKIEGSEDLFKVIGKYDPEKSVKVNYIRDGKEKKTDAVLGKAEMSKRIRMYKNDDNMDFMPPMPEIPGFNNKFFTMKTRKPRLGMQIQDIEESNGVKVIEVMESTPAEKAGLKEGDIITEVNGKEVKNTDELKDAAKDLKEGDILKVKYKRNNSTESTEIKFPKKLKTAEL